MDREVLISSHFRLPQTQQPTISNLPEHLTILTMPSHRIRAGVPQRRAIPYDRNAQRRARAQYEEELAVFRYESHQDLFDDLD